MKTSIKNKNRRHEQNRGTTQTEELSSYWNWKQTGMKNNNRRTEHEQQHRGSNYQASMNHKTTTRFSAIRTARKRAEHQQEESNPGFEQGNGGIEWISAKQTQQFLSLQLKTQTRSTNIPNWIQTLTSTLTLIRKFESKNMKLELEIELEFENEIEIDNEIERN